MSAIGDRVKLVEAAVAKGAQGWAANASGGITGTITANAILKATGASTVGNSSLTDTAGVVEASGTAKVNAGFMVGSTASLTDVNDFGVGSSGIDFLVINQQLTSIPAASQTNGLLSLLRINLSVDAPANTQYTAGNFVISTDEAHTKNIVYPICLSATVINNGSGNITGVNAFQGLIYNESDSTITNAYSGSFGVENDGDGNIGGAYGCIAFGAQNYGSGTITNAYCYYAGSLFGNTGTIDNNFGIWVGDQTHNGSGSTTNSYAFWYDSPGVFRIKYDGVMAYYNPAFSPKYTPGGTNFERIVQQWNTNVAEIGLEAGGTGTLRLLRLLGSAVAIPSAAPANAAATGVAGTVTWDSGFVYVCTATNTWKRAAIATW